MGKKLGWINETSEEASLVRALHTNQAKRGIKVNLYVDNIYKKTFNSYLACSKYLSYFYNIKISDYAISNNLKKHKVIYLENNISLKY